MSRCFRISDDKAYGFIWGKESLRSPAGPMPLAPQHHMTGSGEATRADFAEAIFAEAASRGRRSTRVKRITTADCPTPARRPANSRLDNEKLRRAYGLELPDWRLAECCARRRLPSGRDPWKPKSAGSG